jgi:hypothetical protein
MVMRSLDVSRAAGGAVSIEDSTLFVVRALERMLTQPDVR